MSQLVVAQIMGKWVGGGVESVIMNYYRNMDRSDISFDFICDSDSTVIPYDEINKLGGRVILCPPYQNVIEYHNFLVKLFKKNKYKIVHSNINTLSVFPLWAAKVAGVPIRIAHSHSTSNKKEWKKNILKNILRPFSKKYANVYFACSELAGDYLFGKNSNYKIINNAIDVEKFSFNMNTRKKKRSELNIDDDVLVVGHVGRFVKQKNHEFLIDVFKEIHDKYHNSKLMLIGTGPLEETIRNKVRNLNLNNSVIFLGQRNDVDELYNAMDVFILPSLYEGLVVVGLEAQINGCASFFSTEVTKEVLLSNSSDFIDLKVQPNNWADKILLNAKLRNSIDNICDCEDFLVNNYNIRYEAIKLKEYYFELLNSKV